MSTSTDFKPKKDVEVLKLIFPKGRVVAIGDVHGCLTELEELWGKLQPTPDDLVVFLGDLVDRGPDSEGVVQFVKNAAELGNTFCVLGNHDSKLTRYHYHVLKNKEDPSYKIPMRFPSTYIELSTDSLEYLQSLPHAVFFDKNGTKEPFSLCLVHAGLSPAGFNQPASSFVRNRFFCRNTKDNKITPVKSMEINDIWWVPEGSYPWTHYYDGRWTVLFGHSVNWAPCVKNNCIGIDGGCVFGGTLRSWIKPKVGSSYFVDVPSKMK